MLKGFHWGHGIFLFYVLFVGVLVIAVYASTKVDRSLVIDNYYSLDLDYQNRYDQLQNDIDTDGLQIEQDKTNGEIILNFDHSEPVKGKILLYRASDKSMDFEVDFSGNRASVNSSKMQPGLWKIKVAYSAGKVKFYDESEIFI